jgi:hypothetical protein
MLSSLGPYSGHRCVPTQNWVLASFLANAYQAPRGLVMRPHAKLGDGSTMETI